MFYSKYRPQTIAQLDNGRIRETLGKTILENNWVHAYLFVGPRGTGKTSAARILAKIVNCSKRAKGEEPCNKCDSCLSITTGSNLDVIEIDAASNTGVEDIRDLREKVRLAPTNSKYKVYIIDEVHMLSTSAFNALLKTLEEPPQHVIFVLATTEPQKLPETIISRCLVYDFGGVTQNEIVESLSRVLKGEKIVADKEAVDKLAQFAAGSFRDAHKLLEQLSGQTAKLSLERLDALKPHKIDDAAKELVKLVVQKKAKESLVLVENFAKNDSDKLRGLIDCALSYLRDILLFRSGVMSGGDDVDVSSAEITKLVAMLVEAVGMMRDCPVPQLPLEIAVAEYCNLERPSVSEVVEPAVPEETERIEAPLPDKSPILTQSLEFSETWPKILEAVKPYNHSLVALLRSSRPKEVKDGFLTLDVFYKFHKDKLNEKKNKDILEKVVSDIFGADTKINFVLTEKGKG